MTEQRFLTLLLLLNQGLKLITSGLDKMIREIKAEQA